MQNRKHFFLVFGVSTFGEGGRGQAGWDKIPSKPEIFFFRLAGQGAWRKKIPGKNFPPFFLPEIRPLIVVLFLKGKMGQFFPGKLPYGGGGGGPRRVWQKTILSLFFMDPFPKDFSPCSTFNPGRFEEKKLWVFEQFSWNVTHFSDSVFKKSGRFDTRILPFSIYP